MTVTAYQGVSRAEARRFFSPRPGTRALHDVCVWMFHNRGVRSGGIYNRRTVRGGSALSLHAVGRAADLMVPNREVGWEIALRLIRNAEALGVQEVIFDRKRWTPEKGTVAYRGVNPHTDHVHFSNTIDMADRPDTPQLRQWLAHFVGA